MRPASADDDLILSLSGQFVVHFVPVGDQESSEPLQEFLWMVRLSCLLVFIDDHRLFIQDVAAVDPHVALTAGGSAVLCHKKRCFIRVDDPVRKHFCFEPVIDQ